MVSPVLQNNNPPDLSKLASKTGGYINSVLESKTGRHTLGRVDAVARVAVLAFGGALHLAKLFTQGLVGALSFGKLCSNTTIDNTAKFFVLTLYKTAIAFRDIIVAPNKKYPSSITTLQTVVTQAVNGKDFSRSPDLVTQAIKAQPFFQVFDSDKQS